MKMASNKVAEKHFVVTKDLLLFLSGSEVPDSITNPEYLKALAEGRTKNFKGSPTLYVESQSRSTNFSVLQLLSDWINLYGKIDNKVIMFLCEKSILGERIGFFWEYCIANYKDMEDAIEKLKSSEELKKLINWINSKAKKENIPYKATINCAHSSTTEYPDRISDKPRQYRKTTTYHIGEIRRSKQHSDTNI
jgi:hypothetical protein